MIAIAQPQERTKTMEDRGVVALAQLLKEMQALMGILPVAMVPLVPGPALRPVLRLVPNEAETEDAIEAGFDNMPV